MEVKPPIIVVCALIRFKNKWLLARRSADGALPLKWEFPGGKLEFQETPEAAIKREIWEELNVEIVPEKSGPPVLFTVKAEPYKLIPFLAHMVNDVSPIPIEHSQIAWLKLDAISQLDLAEPDIPVLAWLKNL